MPEIGKHGRADKHARVEVGDLRRAFGVVLGCIHMAPGVEAHMNPADYLLATFSRIVLL